MTQKEFCFVSTANCFIWHNSVFKLRLRLSGCNFFFGFSALRNLPCLLNEKLYRNGSGCNLKSKQMHCTKVFFALTTKFIFWLYLYKLKYGKNGQFDTFRLRYLIILTRWKNLNNGFVFSTLKIFKFS